MDHWSDELGLDIPALKHELRDEIRYTSVDALIKQIHDDVDKTRDMLA